VTQRRTLIRGGTVVTMDSTIGDLPVGDVLVLEGTIAEVAPSIAVTDAEIIEATGHIVYPGLIDTHRHTWQTQMRAICTDWTLADYFYGIRLSISPAYTAEDVHLGNRLGALEAVNAGVTTILDFSHCNNTPDHSDAAVTGLRDAGIRAVFGYGFFESSPHQPPHFASHDERLADFARIADTWFPSSDALLTLGVALTEVGLVPLSVTRAEIEVARAHGALVVGHTGAVWSMPSGVAELDAQGLLGPDQVHVHCNTLSEGEWQALARAGAKVSISVETELNMGMGRPVFAACERHGVKPTLSCDIISLNSGDLLTQVRQGLGFTRWADTEALNLAGADPAEVTTTAHEALEWCTVNAADAIGQADRLGSLTPGKQADIVLAGGPGIGQHPHLDPAGSLIFQTTAADVRTVLVAGEIVKRDGELMGIHLPALLEAADRSAERVLARVRSVVSTLPPTPKAGFGDVVATAAANLKAI
jgi:cytosine/adenosine deaminase-related metal-dependent hydrolase